MYRIRMPNEQKKEFKLKRPTVVHLLAIGFILAPFANLTIPRMLRGQKSWYFPTQWYLLFTRLPLIEQALVLGTIAGGILLFFQRKWSWFVAVIILTVVSGYNIWFHTGSFDQNPLNTVYLVVNASILIVFYYFRFPYLDQRDHIFSGYSKRVEVRIEVQIETKVDGTYDALLKNISDSGCFVEFLKLPNPMVLEQNIDLHFTKPSTQILTATVRYIRASGIGLKFYDLNSDRKKFIEDLKQKSS